MTRARDDHGADVARSIGDSRPRTPCEIEGTVVMLASTPGGLVALDVAVDDGTGTLRCHFTGRRTLPGVVGGTRLRVVGTLTTHRARPCLLNPAYEVLGTEGAPAGVSS